MGGPGSGRHGGGGKQNYYSAIRRNMGPGRTGRNYNRALARQVKSFKGKLKGRLNISY